MRTARYLGVLVILSLALALVPGAIVGAATISGRWGSPSIGDTYAIGDTISFSATALADNGVDHVNFTVRTNIAAPGDWSTACTAPRVPGNGPLFQCQWQVRSGTPLGDAQVGFDVYDRAGQRRNSPDDIRLIHLVAASGGLVIPDSGFTGYPTSWGPNINQGCFLSNTVVCPDGVPNPLSYTDCNQLLGSRGGGPGDVGSFVYCLYQEYHLNTPDVDRVRKGVDCVGLVATLSGFKQLSLAIDLLNAQSTLDAGAALSNQAITDILTKNGLKNLVQQYSQISDTISVIDGLRGCAATAINAAPGALYLYNDVLRQARGAIDCFNSPACRAGMFDPTNWG